MFKKFLLLGVVLGGSLMAQTVVLETSEGEIEIALKPGIAPKATENFVGLVKKGYYDGVIFHRVIPNFMIQGGDPTGTGEGGESLWGECFEDECTPDEQFDRKYLLAMANRGPATNGSQFFITTAETPWLNGKHTIFGEVVSGQKVIDKIEAYGSSSGKTTKELKIKKAYAKGA